jgi:hypothetical protein
MGEGSVGVWGARVRLGVLAGGQGKVRGFPKKQLRFTMKIIQQYMSGNI